MVKIEVPITASSDVELQLFINDDPIEFSIIDGKITAYADFIGLAMLKIKLLNASTIKFDNVFVNDVGVRQCLFLSWVEKDNSKIQPCTELWEKDLIWRMPISNPLSLLLSIASEKFKTGELGTNLFEKYDIHFPESIKIDDQHPTVVKDFFKYNFNFYAEKKIDPSQLYSHTTVPFFFLNFNYDPAAIYKELVDNHDYLVDQEFIKPLQLDYNKSDLKDNFNSKLNWRTVYPYIPDLGRKKAIDEFVLDKDRFSHLFKFYKSLPAKYIYHSYVSIMPPYSFIAPHVDLRKDLDLHGCTQLYFALNHDPKDHFFKLNSVGLVPVFNDRLVCINNQRYTHAVVNQSPNWRYVIGCFADLDEKFYTDVIL
jgi:hypothetical protein